MVEVCETIWYSNNCLLPSVWRSDIPLPNTRGRVKSNYRTYLQVITRERYSGFCWHLQKMPQSGLHIFVYAIPVARISQTISQLILGEYLYVLYCKLFCIWTGLCFGLKVENYWNFISTIPSVTFNLFLLPVVPILEVWQWPGEAFQGRYFMVYVVGHPNDNLSRHQS